MMRGGRRKRVAMLLFVVLIALLLAAPVALLIAGDVGVESSPALAVAVFGTFLTSMAIIAAFSIEEKSRWPTPWETLDRAGVGIWFVVGLASVAAALIATGSDSDFLPALSLTLALIGLLLGARALWGLFSLSSDRGRWKLVVDRLAGSIRDASPPAPGAEADLGEIDTEDHVPAWFLSAESAVLPHRGGVSIEFVPSVMRSYADREDSDAMARLVDEVHAAAVQALEAGGWPDLDAYLASVDTVLGVQRRLFEELTLRVLCGRLPEATARGALERTGETAIDIAGRARATIPWPGKAVRRRVEQLVARHLTALCRVAGAAAAEPVSTEALRTSCSRVQQAARWAVDPGPPGMKLPADHPWRRGLSDPRSALVWLWSAAEAPSGPFGVGLYALCEILTGRKFFGSYWEGLDIYTEIERRLRGGEGKGEPGLSGRTALERAGGLALISLELGAIRLAGRPARKSDGGQRANRLAASELFLAAGGYKPARRDPFADLAWLLTDRTWGSLWTTVQAELRQLPDPVARPSLRPLHRRRDACALVICLRLFPLERGAEKELVELRLFISCLPDRLLEEATELAVRLTGVEADLGGERGVLEERLITAAGRVRMIVPGALPARRAASGEKASAWSARDPAIDGSPAGWETGLAHGGEADEFVEALRQIVEAESEIEVDLIQCDPRWLEQWADLRARLDAALLAAALRGRARVRRIVPFDLSGDAERSMTKLHYRWTEALSTAVGCFVPRIVLPADSESPYEVRQVILPFDKADVSPPADCVTLRGVGGETDAEVALRFESLWARFDPGVRIPARSLGLIELGGRGVSPPGPPLLLES